jgi:hypothetical protein
MSLVKYGIAGALGYYLGQPQGRKQLEQLRQRVIQLSRRPQVKQLQDSAHERALAAKERAVAAITRKAAAAAPAPAATAPVLDPTAFAPDNAGTAAAPTGFCGRTVAEDSEAALTGLTPPPPIGRTLPPHPADRI